MKLLTPIRRLFFLAATLLALHTTAQVSDSFTDGDFTNNPAWSGDASQFLVNGSHQLQLNSTLADTSYLSTPSTSLVTAEWQFWIKLAFAPSDNNNARVYLVSDVANLQGPVNGYYVRLGENGSFDSVDLWEQSGTTSVKIIDGVNGHCAATTNTLRIKVTRDAAGNWDVYSDTLGGTNFLPEGSTNNTAHTSSSFMGLWCKYTVSNITKFYFDDIYSGPPIVDVTAPTIVSATATSATQLDVLFDENVDLTTSQTALNYVVNGGIGAAATAVRDNTNNALVHLTFGNSFVSATPYILTVNGVEDLSGNAISNGTANFSWLTISTPAFRDVIINEIFADPTPQVGLPALEFVEIYNRGTGNYDLNGWAFTDGSSTAALSSYVLGAGQYLILCSAADTASFSPFGPVMGVSSFPSLNNTGDNLYLLDNGSNYIDSVSYSDAWYQDGVKDDGGWTLELINPNAGSGCSVAANWIASTNAAGGTPGQQNSVFNNSPDVTGPALQGVFAIDPTHISVCFDEAINTAQIGVLSSYGIDNGVGSPTAIAIDSATYQCITLTLGTALADQTVYTITFTSLGDCAGNAVTPTSAPFSYYEVKPYDVVINEIMADPDPPQQLPNNEYFEIHNRTTFPLRLENWTLSVGTTTRVIPTVILPADSFLVLCSPTAAPNFTGVNVLGVTSFPALTNTGGTITLRMPNTAIVHSVSYTDSWYNNPAKENGGWSMEMIDPSNPCGGSDNWRASNDPSGGTPGRRNSVIAAHPDQTGPQLLRVTVIASDSIRAWFSESIDSTTYLNPASYSIDNGLGQPLAAVAMAPDFMSVKLKLSSGLLSNILYTLTVANTIEDCAGNALANPNTARFAIAEAAVAGDVLINEVLFDPNDGGTDFVEVYNNSQKVLDLKNIVLCTQDTIGNVFNEVNVIAPESWLLFPGDYLLLSESGAAVKSQYATTNPNAFLDMDNLPAMNVDGDIVVLADTGFHVIDKLVYHDTWHFPLLNNTKGVSLERIRFDSPTQDPTNWHSASSTAGYATPGYKNSEYSEGGDNGEVTVTPQVFSPDADAVDDVVNISFHFDQPGYTANVRIYDDRGRLVRNLVHNELLGTDAGTFSWDGVSDAREKARVGMYVIYFEAFALDGKVKKYKRTCVLAARL